MMSKRVLIGVALCATTTLGVGGSAFAGEVTGNGKKTPVKFGVAKSACAFSGLEDGETLEFPNGPDAPPVVVDTDDSGPGWVQTPHGETSPGVEFPPGIAGQECRGNIVSDL